MDSLYYALCCIADYTTKIWLAIYPAIHTNICIYAIVLLVGSTKKYSLFYHGTKFLWSLQILKTFRKINFPQLQCTPQRYCHLKIVKNPDSCHTVMHTENKLTVTTAETPIWHWKRFTPSYMVAISSLASTCFVEPHKLHNYFAILCAYVYSYVCTMQLNKQLCSIALTWKGNRKSQQWHHLQ